MSLFRLILHDVGVILHLPALMAGVSLLIALAFRDGTSALALLVCAGVSLLCGQCLQKLGAQTHRSERLFSAMLTVVISWMGLIMLCTIPFYLHARMQPQNSSFLPWVNALFESCSGLTSTGLSIVEDPTQLPASLQWWRSLTQWVGGLGVILFTLALTETGEDMYALSQTETNIGKFGANATDTLRKIWGIYLSYTLVGLGLFALLGMPLWQAINHAMSAISTGGFTINQSGFSAYGSGIKAVCLLLMIAGTLNFRGHYSLWCLLRSKSCKQTLPWFQSQVRLFLFLLLSGCTVFVLLFSQKHGWAPIDNIFVYVSALTTSGFSTHKLSQMDPVFFLILLVPMIIGGTSGSTAGGIKLNRITWILKGLHWRLFSVFVSEKQSPCFYFNQKQVETASAFRHIQAAGTLLGLWLATLFIGVLALEILLDEPLSKLTFEAASALGGVGLSSGITAANPGAASKGVLIALMFVGRLEIVAVLVVLLSPLRWLPSRVLDMETHVIDENNA